MLERSFLPCTFMIPSSTLAHSSCSPLSLCGSSFTPIDEEGTLPAPPVPRGYFCGQHQHVSSGSIFQPTPGNDIQRIHYQRHTG